MSKREKRRKATVEASRNRKQRGDFGQRLTNVLQAMGASKDAREADKSGRYDGLQEVLSELHDAAEQAATDLQVSLGMIR